MSSSSSASSQQQLFVRAPTGLVYTATAYEQLTNGGAPNCPTADVGYGRIIATVAVCAVFSAIAIAVLLYFNCFRTETSVDDVVKAYIIEAENTFHDKRRLKSEAMAAMEAEQQQYAENGQQRTTASQQQMLMIENGMAAFDGEEDGQAVYDEEMGEGDYDDGEEEDAMMQNGDEAFIRKMEGRSSAPFG